MKPQEAFAAALFEVESSLDWRALGRHYCSQGGEGFFSEEDREAIRETGLLLSDDVASALPPRGTGRSLYVGAGFAEIAPMLCESIVLAREVRAFSLANDETHMLNDALARASDRLGLELPRIDTSAITSVALPACDHVWIVSVLNDPDAFPALHDELYGRRGTDLATARGDLPGESERARVLLDAALSALRAPGVLTTTDEELDLVAAACRRRGLELRVPEIARLSAIVGDPVRVCHAEFPGTGRA